MKYPNLGREISGSLYDKVELSIEMIVGAFNDRLCKALEECNGRLDRFVGVMAEFEKVAKFGAMTELSALATVDSDASVVRSLIDRVSKILNEREMLLGMGLAHCVHFVQSRTGVSDEEMLALMFPGADEETGSKRLVTVYNGGGTVNLESPDAQAVIRWLKVKLPCCEAGRSS